MATGHSQSITSDELIDFPCSPCAESGRMRQAVKYCVQCQDYYCQSCTDNHATFPALRRHTLLDQADFHSPGKQTNLPSVPTERCNVHRTKIIDMYCRTHDDVGCTACMALDHRTCSDVQFIPDVIGNLKIIEDTSRIQDSLKASKSAAEDTKRMKEESLVELQKSKQDAVKSIKSFHKELEEILAKIEEASIQEVDARCVVIKTSVKSELEEINNHIKNLEEAIRSLESVEGNKAQKFVLLKSAEKLKNISKLASPSSSQSPDRSVLYHINTDVKTLLEGVRSFGQIDVVHKMKSDAKPLEKESTCYRIQQTVNIDLTQKNDTTDYLIYDSCFTEDGYILLSDCKNKKLKRVDVSRACLKDHFDLPAYPFGVCCTYLQEAAVCLCDNRGSGSTVQLVSLGTTMKLSRQLMLKHVCNSVAYSNGELFISDNNDTVYVYNMTGGCLGKIACPNKQKIQHIAYEPSANRLYVAACDCLLIYDRNGKHVATFSDPVIQGVTGVCTDGKGGAFICGYELKNVIYLRQNGGKQELLGCQDLVELGALRSLSFNKSNKLLCVTSKSGIITMLKLREN